MVTLGQPNFAPDPEYADDLRMFQGIPAIERSSNGRLWAAWYSGGVTEDDENYIILDTSGDDGRTWQRALVFDPDGPGPLRAFDPCLWHDPSGQLWLFWAQGTRHQQPAETFAITTTDSGNRHAQWTAPRRVFTGILMNKPTIRADGLWIFPTAVWHAADSVRVLSSADGGQSFCQLGAAGIGLPAERDCDEPMLVQRRDGSLWMLVRTKYGIGETVSRDGGKTWSAVAPGRIPHVASRFFIRRLTSGRLLLVRHNAPERSRLTAYLSDDEGRTWQGGLVLDERRQVSYPDGVEAGNGLVYLIYDFDRQGAKEILMAAFREEDVRHGKALSTDTRLRVRVNQALGRNPKRTP